MTARPKNNIPKAAGRVKRMKPFLKAGGKAKLKKAVTVIFALKEACF